MQCCLDPFILYKSKDYLFSTVAKQGLYFSEEVQRKDHVAHVRDRG